MTYQQFAYTRDERGRPAEYLTVELYRSYGLDASINDAPEEDYEGRASHDIAVAGYLHDIKTDYWARKTKRIFVERASLEHTKAYYFDYWIPTPYGYDIRVFTKQQLIGYYNAINEVHRLDGSTYQVHVYEHGIAGDQANNDGVFVPLEVVKADGLAPWQFVKMINETARAS